MAKVRSPGRAGWDRFSSRLANNLLWILLLLRDSQESGHLVTNSDHLRSPGFAIQRVAFTRFGVSTLGRYVF